MHLCYIDESGVSAIPGNTSHFVLAGIAIPVLLWSKADSEITAVLKKYGLEDAEMHTGWILRPYLEQNRIADFQKLSWKDRRAAVQQERTKELLALQQKGKRKPYQQAKKNFRLTESYVHLTFDERKQLMLEVATVIGKWDFAKLFAECIDKTYFNPAKARAGIDEQAFEQLVSRFEQYLVNTSPKNGQKHNGLIVHDNNETIARKHTILMREFRDNGTVWNKIEQIIETPLFVNSSLTRLVQVADLCAYALRRYLEKAEETLFDQVFKRADRAGNKVLGVRHFADPKCKCQICIAHKATAKAAAVGAKTKKP
ncbi:MAG: DUF3800 domain-containing protein [Acidobacteriaceae bacterium]